MAPAAILVGMSIWFWHDHHSLVNEVSQENGHQYQQQQTADYNNMQLIKCLGAADQKYTDTWASVCAQAGDTSGVGGLCNTFVGSPKDVQFTQLRDQEKAQCATLYK